MENHLVRNEIQNGPQSSDQAKDFEKKELESIVK
jgi:hypothetical protein